MLGSGFNELELAEFVKKNIPRTHTYQSNNRVKCYFCVDEFGQVDHKIKRSHRECKEKDNEKDADCQVIFRVDFCKMADIGRIEQSGTHSHFVSTQHNNKNGLPQSLNRQLS